MGVLSSDEQVIADPIAALLPGLLGEFPKLEIVEIDTIRSALQAHEKQLVQREQALNFVTNLPRLNEKITADEAPAVPPPTTLDSHPVTPASRATHILQNHTAHSLTAPGLKVAKGWEFFLDDQGWQLRGNGSALSVNGHPYQIGQILGVGDSVTTDDGTRAMLIEVKN